MLEVLSEYYRSYRNHYGLRKLASLQSGKRYIDPAVAHYVVCLPATIVATYTLRTWNPKARRFDFFEKQKAGEKTVSEGARYHVKADRITHEKPKL